MGANLPLIKAGKHPPPPRVGNQPPQAEAGSQLPQGARLTNPRGGKEWVMARIGTKGPSGGLKGECLSPKALPTQLGLERSRNLDRSFRNIYIIPSFPTREQHAHSVQNARSRFTKLNQ